MEDDLKIFKQPLVGSYPNFKLRLRRPKLSVGIVQMNVIVLTIGIITRLGLSLVMTTSFINTLVMFISGSVNKYTL